VRFCRKRQSRDSGSRLWLIMRSKGPAEANAEPLFL